ncbi:hypothetical protein KSF_007380 [Reticulibacter mediterranei]|uniref:Endo-beta-1,6-galactanase-like domain-containing protein n=1 Tax=Reticulibacter mediterranei TaxID=2778369 RepID=A0A8J3IH84_9CHLR|nr:glycoside hydrolase [Reticulibacter mediterranei]GHO90690.1 hypothetical protein KSF_007380 [Reticulibacter mediterranei]
MISWSPCSSRRNETPCSANGAENISSTHYSNFTSYIATITKHFHDSFGITLKTVDPFNEPGGTWWTSTNTQEGMYVSTNTQNAIIPLVASALSQNRNSSKVLEVSAFSTVDGGTNQQWSLI